MRLHRLTVTAFGPFGSTQEVDFDTLSAAGLFLLHGPTGAGKTSVLDAVCFALYGAVPGARQSPGTSLRSDHAEVGTPTEVRLELTVAGRRLEVTRRPAQPRPKARGTGFVTERAQSLLREYDAEAREWRPLSKSHQEIGEEITQLLGMSRDQFCQVVLLPQGDFARFLRADAEARGKLLGRLFDTRRFAAVEERLAELRRAAEAQVRAGDERLLALAHRMAQAAGDAADGRPLPEQQPGDPGLAAAVLQWAAVARSGARERLDIAGQAVAAAERRQAAARRVLDTERDLSRLQQRYADARRRAESLEAARPGHEVLVADLERARKADLVGPALRLRDEAERAHRAAGAERERTRRGLPADLAEAGAEQLLGRERTLRQELGGLESARRAEQRSADIARERADLDRQARADEEMLEEATAWLAEWEGLRRSRLDRIAAAQEAATRAEQLAGRLGPARDRLGAACERDELTARAERAEIRLRTLHEGANRAKAAWLDLKERRLLGIAAELASQLTPGQPCAVCGSESHPAPARAASGHVDRAAEEEAYAASARAETARAEAERDLAVLHEARTTAASRARTTTRSHATGGAVATAVPGGAGESVPPGAAAGAAVEAAEPREAEAGGVAALAAARGGAVDAVEAATGTTRARDGGRERSAAVEAAARGSAGDPERSGVPGGVGEAVPAASAGAPEAVVAGSDVQAVAECAEGATSGPADVPRGRVPGPREEMGDPSVGELRAALEELEREHAQAHRLASGVHAAQEALEQAEREHRERVDARQQAERRISARTSRREALDQEQAALEAELTRARGDAASVADRAAVLERRVGLLAAAAEAVRALDAAEQRLKDADDRLADAAFRAGFDTPAAAAAAVVAEGAQRDMQRRIDAWRTEEAAVAERLAEDDARSAAERPAADPASAEAGALAADRTLRDAASRLAAARDRCAELDRLSRESEREVLRLGPLRERYDRVARLAGLTAGTSADNERRMRLESYVLAARLEQVAAAATVRLQRMSSGRYTLVHSDARTGGKRAGLGLHVVDAWTGRERDTATLSGGETFFASLALALGLADVVTDEAGGMRLDTLFIDEGFGSLDDQTLDEVLDVLDSLRERDRSVGIVSHVGDLRRRVPAQLEVVKERHGSAVRLRTGGSGD
ncbi:SMC family ATPase [Streptomyces sp. PKU-EA00015]|uniref:AAA family ATPase n=1 Tax=Streptomyces sp. PKU-EA00015 TaxID=2748326 RepID=UPI0015A481D9|nr:SMC family ATPase [Streptomyces sp. PKU-EA00015]NWF30549.1 SMC family ATPase [Streptomyces sp. PKU-EA00015]